MAGTEAGAGAGARTRAWTEAGTGARTRAGTMAGTEAGAGTTTSPSPPENQAIVWLLRSSRVRGGGRGRA
jgi:hypothetical protein